MKIGLNATCFNDRPSGAKQRFIGIYTELFKLLNNHEFIVYEPYDCKIRDWFDKPQNVVFKKTPLLSYSRFQKYFRGLLYWPEALKDENFDFFEGFHLPLVKSPTGHTLLTIHDIRGIFLKSSWIEDFMYKRTLEQSLKKATHVITVSDAVKKEILKHYPNTSISVVYNGIDIKYFENISEPELLLVNQNLNLPKEFLLAVGHFERRKNYLNLIDAIDRLHKQGCGVYLVIVGNDSGEMSKLNEKVHELKLYSYVKTFSGLTNLEVKSIYNLCKLLVFPSSYEGFGIPILEAMAAKCPMVLSDLPVFREITEEQGVFFLHDNPDSIASAINKVISTSEERDRLIQYGNHRIQDFSFSKLSRDLDSVYKSLL